MVTTRKQKAAAHKKMLAAVASLAKTAAIGAVKGAIKGGARSYLNSKKPKSHVSKSVSVGTKRRRPKYDTTGVYKGQFNKPKAYKPSMASKVGASVEFEKGGQVTSQDCVYLGHSISINQLTRQVSRSIIRRLFQQLRESPRGWFEKLKPFETVTQPCLEMRVMYMVNNDSPAQITSATFQSTQSLDEVVFWFESQFWLAATNEIRPIRSIWIFNHSPTANPQELPLAYLDLDNIHLHINCSSKMSIQNRTLGATATSTSMDDITNNPLEGKVYSGTGNGTLLQTQDNVVGMAGNDFWGTLADGIIQFDPLGTPVTAQQASVLRRPPTANAFVAVRSVAKVRLGPGAIKKSVWSWNRSMKFSKYIEYMQSRLRANGDVKTPVSLGKFEFLGLEKMVRTRNAGTGVPAVSVGYELNQVIGCYTTLVRRGMPREQRVFDVVILFCVAGTLYHSSKFR